MFAWLTSFFAHPAMLAGTAAGSIPVIIHLLNRQRFKRIWWAAMHWLWAAQRKAHRRQRIEQLLLLLIRILILVLLALALARPALQEGMGLIAGRSSIHRVIVLDNSYSMGHAIAGQTLFDKAKVLAAQLVDGLNPGDEVDVLLMNSHAEELTPTSNLKHAEVKRDLEAAKLSDAGTHVPRGIAAACKLIAERRSANLRKEIIVITDRTRAGWETASGPRKLSAPEEEHIANVFADPKLKPRIWVARLTSGESLENLAAASVEIEEKVVTARVETQIGATFRNLGTQTAFEVPVTLFVDGVKERTEKIKALEPLKPQTVLFRYNFPDAGSHSVSVALEPDLLKADNTASLALDVEKQVRVLCVDGQRLTGALRSEMDYFKQALSPTRSEDLKTPLDPEVIDDGAFPEKNLDDYRLVVLANVALIQKEKIEALTQYVRRGGSVWIWLGHRTSPAIYNKDLGHLLPCTIGDSAGDESNREEFVRLSEKGLDHPAIHKLLNIKELPFHELHVYRRYKLLLPEAVEGSQGGEGAAKEPEGVRTVLRYEDGSPAALERRIGQGRVVLFGTTADKEWNNWPLKRHYLLLVNFLTLDLINPAYLERNREVGEAFEFRLPKDRVSEARREGVVLLSPDGEPIPMDIGNESFSALSRPVSQAGIYTAEIAGEPPMVVHFAANRNLEESDLDTVKDEDLQAYLPERPEDQPERGKLFEKGVLREDVIFAGEDLKDLEASLKKHSGGKEIWRWLVVAVLLLLVAESFLAQRFGNYGS